MTILEDYLDTFPGIVVTVSHDRYFLDRVVNRIFAFEGDGRISRYEGGYTDYQNALESRGTSGEAGSAPERDGGRAAKKEAADGAADASGGQVNRDNWKERSGAERKLKLSYKEQREWETIEDDIAALEEKVAEIERQIEASASNYSRLNELMAEKEKAEAKLEETMEFCEDGRTDCSADHPRF